MPLLSLFRISVTKEINDTTWCNYYCDNQRWYTATNICIRTGLDIHDPIDNWRRYGDGDNSFVTCIQEFNHNICSHVSIKEYSLNSTCSKDELFEESVYVTNVCIWALDDGEMMYTCNNNSYFTKKCGDNGKFWHKHQIDEDVCNKTRLVIGCFGEQDKTQNISLCVLLFFLVFLAM